MAKESKDWNTCRTSKIVSKIVANDSSSTATVSFRFYAIYFFQQKGNDLVRVRVRLDRLA